MVEKERVPMPCSISSLSSLCRASGLGRPGESWAQPIGSVILVAEGGSELLRLELCIVCTSGKCNVDNSNVGENMRNHNNLGNNLV